MGVVFVGWGFCFVGMFVVVLCCVVLCCIVLCCVVLCCVDISTRITVTMTFIVASLSLQ